MKADVEYENKVPILNQISGPKNENVAVHNSKPFIPISNKPNRVVVKDSAGKITSIGRAQRLPVASGAGGTASLPSVQGTNNWKLFFVYLCRSKWSWCC